MEVSRTRTDCRSDDTDGRAYRHQPIELRDVRVWHPHTSVGDSTWQEVRLVGSVDSDNSAARPVAEH